jgi:hypothetical protein
MKKVGIAVFIVAIAIGIIAGNFISFGRVTGKLFNFGFGRGVQGSGVLASERVDVSGFKGVDVGGVFQVEMTARQDYSVEVSADDNILPLVKVYVSDGVLKIATEGRFSNSNPIRVRVSAPDIESIEASGASKVNVSNLKNSSLKIDTSGASRVSVAGETSNLTIDVSGASSVDAEALKAGNADVDASGASCVKVLALNRLMSEASGASRITYTGNPASVEKKSSGAGKISQK